MSDPVDAVDSPEPGPEPELTQREALLLFRLKFSDDARAEGLALAEPWRSMAVRLLDAKVEMRRHLMDEMTAALPPEKQAELERAQGKIGRNVRVARIPRPAPPATPEAAPPPDDVPAPIPEAEAATEPRAIPSPRPAPSPAAAAVDPWPAPLGPPALSGAAGELVKLIEPTTEADPAAVLIQFLVGFGGMVGRGPHVRVDGHQHGANLFAVVVGDTSRARKGTSWRRVREALAACDAEWASGRIVGGLSSGEGLVWAVRDPSASPSRKPGVEAVVDPGEDDKRLLVVENEFGGALRMMGREGNTLSAVLRLAYDGEDLRFLTKNCPASATAPHISMCGHVTREELEKHLSAVEASNGLGNRILWACARRSKSLPFGGDADALSLECLARFLAGLAGDARTVGEVSWAPSGARLWDAAYDHLTAPKPGLLGALTARAETHTLRLALIYALLDRSREIADEHVEAALAVWRYCADSAALLFGRSSSEFQADRVLAVLAQRPEGLSRSELQREAFTRSTPTATIARIMDSLVRSGAVTRETITTGGRPADRFFAA